MKGALRCLAFAPRPASDFDLVPSHPRDVQHNQNVDGQDDPMQLVGVLEHLPHFKWDIQTAGADGQPFRPDTLSPQAVAFQETQRGVGDGDAQDHPDAGAGEFLDGVQELVREMAGWIDVKEEEDVLSSFFEVNIVADHADENVSADQSQHALQGLDECNRAQARSMSAPQHYFSIVRCGDTAHP